MSVGLIWRALCLLSILCTLSRHVHCTENQPDLSGTERGLTFSHVYKIDIPGSSSCTVERLPVQETGLQQDTTSNGENDIIFKHNIRLQTSKCNCEESESFKELLYRVNGLEEEVNYLKTQCTQGCCGRGGAPGVDTSCSDHGTYQHDTCSCLCNPGWEGPDCSVSSCPDECSDNGRCVDGRCVCYEGYTGEDCSQLTCPGDCNDKGQCVDGKCVCFPHFTGEDCSIPKCPNDCEGNGQCVDGQCVCDDGFYGEDCSTVLAPKGLQLIQKTDVSLLVEWETVQGAEYYMLTYHPKFDEGAVEEVQIPNSENSYLITDLTPGVTYIVKVYAVIKKIQSEADMIKATTDVSTIDDMRVTGQTEVSIQVDWKNPQAEVDYFRLTHTDPSGQEEELNVQRSQEARTKHTIVGLYPGTEYQISVQSIKGNAEGKASFTTGVTDIDAPSNLVTTEVTEDTATVSWDKVQAEIEGYMLSYTSAEGSSSEIFVGRDSTSYRLVGLRPGVLHTVYIWAFRGDKVSEKSSTEAETELDAPTNLSVEDETDSSFRVYWDPTQAQIDGYMLTYSSSDGSREETPVGSDSSYVLTGLRPGVVYTVYLWAVRGSKASRKISTEAETEMDAPANLIASDITESSFSLSWDPVQAEIDGYILTYTSPDGSSKEIVVGPDSSTYILTGLQPAGLYIVYIKAMKRDKTSRSTSTQAETEMDAPANLIASDITESSFSLSWDPVQAEIDGYILTYTSPDGSSKEIPVGPESSTYMLTGLRPAVLYTVYIQAMKGDKTSKEISAQAETEMDAPANLKTRDITESSFSLSWDPVQAEIDGYILTYTSPDGSSKEIPVGPDSSTYILTGLRPAVLYTVYIQAMRREKTSRTISTQAETEIDSPKDLKATDVTIDSALLTWAPPLADIEGYILTYREEEGNLQAIERRLDASETSFTASNLKMGKRYIVTIVAFRGSKRSRMVETLFKTVAMLYPFPMDCVQIMRNGNNNNGIYTVYINNNQSKPIEVFCDMTTDGGGWLVLQRRNTGKLDFMKRWRQYIAGFGNMTEEFWLGLDKIYALTNTPTQYELRFDLGLGSERAYAVYDNFKIAPIRQKFKLTIGKYRGTAGDAMTYHQDRLWTTIDSDNDIALTNCARTHSGAWWYANCHLANLNGKWGDNRHSLGVNWEPWKGHLTSLDFTEMKIRPVGALSSRKKRSLMVREKKSRVSNTHK
ncbi:tenascin-N isoform X10 [Cyprinodon tularosa]|uniref:tenascin-N isoform X10 n=1 Tax=Cyprinodon tularosa TaxID=77115 RepID=UPI0018E2440B|nr:tenascin-N isoform X10 [Cyprinodon tularosa]